MKDKKLLAGGALLLGAAGFWFFLKPMFFAPPAPPPVYTEEEIAAAPRPTLTLEETVLNLRSTGGVASYVKVQLALEFEDPDHAYIGMSAEGVAHANEELAHHMEPDMHRIKDAVNSVIGAKTLEEVATPEAREHLKEELVTALNEHLHHQKVEEVFFLTFITQ